MTVLCKWLRNIQTPKPFLFIGQINIRFMKTDTSMNLMLVVFCVILIGFVLLNSRMSDTLNKKQADFEKRSQVKWPQECRLKIVTAPVTIPVSVSTFLPGKHPGSEKISSLFGVWWNCPNIIPLETRAKRHLFYSYKVHNHHCLRIFSLIKLRPKP